MKTELPNKLPMLASTSLSLGDQFYILDVVTQTFMIHSITIADTVCRPVPMPGQDNIADWCKCCIPDKMDEETFTNYRVQLIPTADEQGNCCYRVFIECLDPNIRNIISASERTYSLLGALECVQEWYDSCLNTQAP